MQRCDHAGGCVYIYIIYVKYSCSAYKLDELQKKESLLSEFFFSHSRFQSYLSPRGGKSAGFFFITLRVRDAFVTLRAILCLYMRMCACVFVCVYSWQEKDCHTFTSTNLGTHPTRNGKTNDQNSARVNKTSKLGSSHKFRLTGNFIDLNGFLVTSNGTSSFFIRDI